jgi:Ankyrin repeat
LELLRIGIPLQSQDKQGNSALHLAAKSGNMAVAKALVESGADVNARNKHNRTPKMVVRSSALPQYALKSSRSHTSPSGCHPWFPFLSCLQCTCPVVTHRLVWCVNRAERFDVTIVHAAEDWGRNEGLSI